MSSVRHGDRVDVSTYPDDIQKAYEVFAVRCSRCHTLARPLNARIRDPEHWVRYVTRMRRNPGSGINEKDAEIILRFLFYYTQQVAAEEDGAETAPEEPPPSPPPPSPVPTVTPATPQEAPGAPPPASGSPGASEGPMTKPAPEPMDGGLL